MKKTKRRKNKVLNGNGRMARLKAEIASLNEQMRHYRSLSDEAADAICIVDLTGKITYANKAQAKLLNTPLKEILGSHFRKYLDNDSLQRAYKYFRMAKSGKRIHDELDIRDSKKNLIPVEFHSTPMSRNGKPYAIHTIVRDIRGRKDFEKLQRESEKMQALNNFVSGAAQEIKYPLQAVLNRLQKMAKEYRTRDFEYIGYKEFKGIISTIDNVSQQVRYCFDTTNRLINLTKKNIGTHRSKCDINRVVGLSVKLIDHQFMQPNTKIKSKLAKDLPPAAINETEFSQIIVNLLTNAVQAMPTGGNVSITTSYSKNKRLVCISIRDQGIGIKKEHLKRIYEPFFTTKQRGLEKSSGLGLSIVYSIVQAHRGHIDVVSNLRHGTHVKIELPAAEEK